MEKCAMTPPRRLVLLMALAALLVPLAGNAQVLGTIAGSVRDASGAVLPGVTVEAASPALIEKVRSVTTGGSGQYTDRQPAARHLHRQLHAARLQHRQARGAPGVGELHVQRRRRDARRRGGGDHHRHRREPRRRPAVRRDYADSDGHGVQGAAVGRLVGPAGGADARGEGQQRGRGRRAGRPDGCRRFRRTAAARPTASR